MKLMWLAGDLAWIIHQRLIRSEVAIGIRMIGKLSTLKSLPMNAKKEPQLSGKVEAAMASLVEGADRGVIFYGDNGTMRTGNDGYAIYDLDDNLIKEVKPEVVVDGRNTVSPSAVLDNPHIENFLDCVRTGGTPNADVEIGHKSTLWVQLGNIAQRVGRSLNIDQKNGHILSDTEAMKLWGREYEPGWEPKL